VSAFFQLFCAQVQHMEQVLGLQVLDQVIGKYAI
jgi:hypothetical protein